MRESQTIKGWMREGAEIAELRVMRACLLKVIRVKLEDPVPETIRLAIERTNDVSELDLWYEVALKAKSLADIRKQMKLVP
jgi:hypothetical protein